MWLKHFILDVQRRQLKAAVSLSLDFLYDLHAEVSLCYIVLRLNRGLLCWWLAWSFLNSLCCS